MRKYNSSHILRYFLTALIFFTAGVLFSNIYTNAQTQTQASINDQPANQVQYTSDMSSNEEISSSPTPTSSLQYQEISLKKKTPIQPSDKFTIVEIGKITSDKTSAQTGENVNFTVTLKNTSIKKKFLTHICFNYSSGVTFGCILNKNLYPGNEFNINNSMMFPNPGTYDIWVTWSQDKINFYRPIQAGTTRVYIE